MLICCLSNTQKCWQSYSNQIIFIPIFLIMVSLGIKAVMFFSLHSTKIALINQVRCIILKIFLGIHLLQRLVAVFALLLPLPVTPLGHICVYGSMCETELTVTFTAAKLYLCLVTRSRQLNLDRIPNIVDYAMPVFSSQLRCLVVVVYSIYLCRNDICQGVTVRLLKYV
jgi:hypothetical protein